MKTRESGMPDEEQWKSYFNPDFILEELGIVRTCQSVVDLGCGYGTFTFPAARRISGTIYAFDIDPNMINACQTKIEQAMIKNIICQQRDFVTEGTGLSDNSTDFVMLFNILHAENPIGLLNEAYRILVPGGRVGVIHWNYDPTTPRGPSMEIRPRPEQCQEWIRTAGFQLIRPWIDLPPYHFGMVGQKAMRILKD
jgi:SAM-dependent methyltransferase